jgi:bifunctional DNA-binding transcriptional regulator/antitoxin component of YhaV-PrlF toxin-antitoxin module
MATNLPRYTSYEVIAQEADDGDILIPIPPLLLSELGWKENDVIEISIDEHGRYIFKRGEK